MTTLQNLPSNYSTYLALRVRDTHERVTGNIGSITKDVDLDPNETLYYGDIDTGIPAAILLAINETTSKNFIDEDQIYILTKMNLIQSILEHYKDWQTNSYYVSKGNISKKANIAGMILAESDVMMMGTEEQEDVRT
jgi:hypothetical protein